MASHVHDPFNHFKKHNPLLKKMQQSPYVRRFSAGKVRAKPYKCPYCGTKIFGDDREINRLDPTKDFHCYSCNSRVFKGKK